MTGRKYIIASMDLRPLCYNAGLGFWVPCPQATVFPSIREAIAVAPQESGVRIEYVGDPGGPKWRWLDGAWVSGSRKFPRGSEV